MSPAPQFLFYFSRFLKIVFAEFFFCCFGIFIADFMIRDDECEHFRGISLYFLYSRGLVINPGYTAH
jgi:hypothetical protein